MSEDYLLLVAGEVYGDFKKYEELIDKLEVRNKINLQVRYIPEAEIPIFFSASDVCVLPYRTATQSGIVGIAYHFEIPVIVTNVGGLAEMVEENKTGLIVKHTEPAEISDKLKHYFENNLKDKFIPFIKKYKSKYSWNVFANMIVNLYNKII